MSVLRVWNLRRGDADDDRLSPYAGGLRKLFVAAVFEFNYLKAPVGFFFVVILPALIVGIAPSLVVTFGHLLLHTTTLAGTNVAMIGGIVAVFLGIGFLMGRPLFMKAFANFRHLQYTLVFPIFVAIREFLRTVAERLGGGSSMTAERLGRIRQIATALAALLFAAGGLLLALKVELSFGLKLLDVQHVRVLTVIQAALGNAAVILGFSTAVESLFWFWRELTLAGPALDWAPSSAESPPSVLRIAHLSDLHIVGERYGYRMETGTHGARGNRSFRNALRKLAAIHAKTPLDCVLVTGDITDAGTRAEWAAFMDLLRTCPDLRERLSLVPGNHDVNIVDRSNPGRLDLPWSGGQGLRKLRFLLALDAIQGDRVRLVDDASGDLGLFLRDYLRESKRLQSLRSLALHGSIRGRWEMINAWNDIFPLIEPPKDDRCGLILLDSNAVSHFSLTNAIGVVSPSQLKRLKLMLRNFPRSSWIILLHHSVVEYPDTSISLKDRIGLALVNAPELLAAIRPYTSRVIILHGHRHMDWIGTWGDLVLSSAPSVSLGSGSRGTLHGSFHVHELNLLGDAGVRLLRTRSIEVH